MPKPQLLLLIVGMPGSGKSAAADLIVKHFNAVAFHSGDIIREEIKARGLKYSPTADMAVAHWFHTGGREVRVAELTWQKIKRKRKPILVIEGFRAPSQVKVLTELAGQKPLIIAITAPFRIRHAREHARGRFGKKESESYLRRRDKLELGHGLGKLIRAADCRIDNSGTPARLEERIVELVTGLLHEAKI